SNHTLRLNLGRSARRFLRYHSVLSMITIIQQPAAINFSLSLLRVKLTSTDDQINAKLSKGADLIVDEVYDLPPNGQALELNYEDLVDLLLTAHQPDYNSA